MAKLFDFAEMDKQAWEYFIANKVKQDKGLLKHIYDAYDGDKAKISLRNKYIHAWGKEFLAKITRGYNIMTKVMEEKDKRIKQLEKELEANKDAVSLGNLDMNSYIGNGEKFDLEQFKAILQGICIKGNDNNKVSAGNLLAKLEGWGENDNDDFEIVICPFKDILEKEIQELLAKKKELER